MDFHCNRAPGRKFQHAGSVGSGGAGLPAATEQKRQLRVQISPKIKTVAVPRAQHSPRFGQLAWIQMVCRSRLPRVLSVSLKVWPAGKGRLSQGGSLPFWGWGLAWESLMALGNRSSIVQRAFA